MGKAVYLLIIMILLIPLPYAAAQDTTAKKDPTRILIDHAHQFLFFGAWTLPPLFRQMGFEAIGSQSTLDAVLDPGGKSRVRLGKEKDRPFDWMPNPRFDVIFTYQNDPKAQTYLPEEVEAVKRFVDSGGGLIMVGGTGDEGKPLPLNTLSTIFGARFTEDKTDYKGVKLPVVLVSKAWEKLLSTSDGNPVCAIRSYGRGKVAVIADLRLINWAESKSKEINQLWCGRLLYNLINRVTPEQVSHDGTAIPVCEEYGGGPIYPDQEAQIGDITVYYAKNQKPELLKAVADDMPAVKKQLEAWLPSIPYKGKMHLILAAGGGGGWAVNIFAPKEVGIISLDAEGVLSVFAHELAHIMYGPANDKGQTAGRLPELFSEAHAGWFQGKIEEMRTGSRGNHDPDKLFDIDKDGKTIDLAKVRENDREKGWTKLWWVFQKLDERYGTTWYPRWLWVKSVRWQDEPDKRLTWDDVVEDMSIAVGEDLFQFFRSIGTTLSKESLPSIRFQNKRLELTPAAIEITRTGKARLEPAGDYKEPIR